MQGAKSLRDLLEEIESLKQRLAAKDVQIVQLEADLKAKDEKIDPTGGKRIARAIARMHGIRFQELISQRRHQRYVRARQHAMWAMREHTTLSLPQIGRLLGGRDHTTVIHGIRQHESRLNGAGGGR